MKGICFIEPLHNKTVQKIKIQTRRIISLPPYQGKKWVLYSSNNERNKFEFIDGVGHSYELAPRYKVGEILYLKEPYIDDSDMFFTVFPIHETLTYKGGKIIYQYGNDTSILDSVYGDLAKWKNKLFMPASAARYFIKITGVRAERLQDISEENCKREGIEEFTKDGSIYKYSIDSCAWADMLRSPKEAYAALIDKINGKSTWESNPYVWVYDYELIDKPEII